MNKIKKIFQKHQNEFHSFKDIKNKLSKRDDLHAFLLLDKIIPNDHSMIASADHDVIYLNIEIEDLEQAVTEEQIIELIRCGVFYDEEFDCLGMFV